MLTVVHSISSYSRILEYYFSLKQSLLTFYCSTLYMTPHSYRLGLKFNEGAQGHILPLVPFHFPSLYAFHFLLHLSPLLIGFPHLYPSPFSPHFLSFSCGFPTFISPPSICPLYLSSPCFTVSLNIFYIPPPFSTSFFFISFSPSIILLSLSPSSHFFSIPFLFLPTFLLSTLYALYISMQILFGLPHFFSHLPFFLFFLNPHSLLLPFFYFPVSTLSTTIFLFSSSTPFSINWSSLPSF